ncbi:S8 family serine peptidase [Kribbella sp. NBC_00359]|uniref:S8 family serine peptidase n=1 Tax=Kribbella sp. NBC_00359 TaxID=2975966 RepID=UPI002E1DA6D8
MMPEPARSAPRILGADSGATAGQYIVGLKDDAWVTAHGVPTSAKQLAHAYQGHVKNVWQAALHGFSVSMNADQALKLAADPNVAWVQQEHRYHTNSTQVKPSVVGADVWGIDRLDQRQQPLNDRFRYQGTAGAGVRIYVVDSGIHAIDPVTGAANPDFGTRVTLGPNFVTSESPAHPNSDDCLGHGTAVAGLAASARYGVAKAAQLVALRAFDCKGNADTDDPIINAINYVITNGIKPAVINLSLGPECVDPDGPGQPTACASGSFPAIVAAVESAIQHGIPVVTAAGEALRPNTHPIDDCGDPLAAAAGTISVGATNATNDGYAAYSDFGQCVSIWAPGTNLQSDSWASFTATVTSSGTSFAAPYVAGAVAMLLGTGQFSTVPDVQLAAAVKAQIISNATEGQITGLPSSSRNALLYVPPTLEGSSVALAKTSTGALQAFGTVSAPGNMFFSNQTAPNAHTWNAWTQSANREWLSTAADANADTRVQLMGLTNTGSIFQRQQAKVDMPGFVGWSQVNGLLQSVAIARNQNGVIEGLGVNKDGTAFFNAQSSAGASTWGSSWTPFTFTGAPVPEFTSIAAETDNDNVIESFAVDTHGRVWKSEQTSPNAGTWTEFTQLTDPSNQLVSEVAVARDGTGKLDLIATDASNAMYQRSQTDPGAATWTPWTLIRNGSAIMHLAAETNANGTVALLTVDDTGSIVQMDQTSPGSTIYDNFTINGTLRS